MRIDGTRIRTFLWIILGTLGYFLYLQWDAEHPKAHSTLADEVASNLVPQLIPSATNSSIPSVNSPQPLPASQSQTASSNVISVETDTLSLKISLEGGDIVYAALKDYPAELGSTSPVVLLDKTSERYYFAQTGIVSELGPDVANRPRPLYRVAQTSFEMADKELVVPLEWTNERGVKFTKRFVFHPQSHAVDIEVVVDNTSNFAWSGQFFHQIQRQKTVVPGGFLSGMQMYQGAALYTNDKPYKKLSYDDMKGSDLSKPVQGGWVAMLERYFLSAFIQNPEEEYHAYSRALPNNIFAIGSLGAQKTIQAHETGSFSTKIYLGPTKPDVLKTLAPGLDLTVDYGFLWPIAKVLFWCLKHIQDVVSNWGVAIILVTMLVKLVFFRLASSNYRTMAKMRMAQPHLARLKEIHGDDRARYSQAVFEFYKKEKMNPLGGCLPMLIPVPVFIALYYMLSESVELRQAPFIGWITDLSVKDPYYILPLIFGLTAFLQQKLSPPPADPVQAKVMAFMPVVFAALFIQFPAGLVLYWVANNVLSMGQQWYITRSIESQGMSKTFSAK